MGMRELVGENLWEGGNMGENLRGGEEIWKLELDRQITS